jgi:hypothetical protein
MLAVQATVLSVTNEAMEVTTESESGRGFGYYDIGEEMHGARLEIPFSRVESASRKNRNRLLAAGIGGLSGVLGGALIGYAIAGPPENCGTVVACIEARETTVVLTGLSAGLLGAGIGWVVAGPSWIALEIPVPN